MSDNLITSLKKKMSDECIDPASIHGLTIFRGDKLIIRIRGKAREEIECEFICFNPLYGSLQLLCGDDIYLVKMSSILYIRYKSSENIPVKNNKNSKKKKKT